MTRSEELSQWGAELNRQLPSLSKPQATELALWSIGMVLAGSSSLSKVALHILVWLNEQHKLLKSYRERLRNWYLPAERKAGHNRRDFHPDDIFGELALWVLRLAPDKRVVLAMDATTLRDRVTVLCISILIGGCAIPVAWRCLPGNQKEEWNKHWHSLLETLSAAIGKETEIIILTDRGLWSPGLFQTIQGKGWHPLMRINWDNGQNCSLFRLSGKQWRPMVSLAPARGQEVRLVGEAFASHEIPSTLIIYWGESAQEPWYLLTDVSPLPNVEGLLYAERMWIEHQFKTIKSDGFDASRSRITDPDRIARLWLAYAVAMLWTMSVGSHPIAGVDKPVEAFDKSESAETGKYSALCDMSSSPEHSRSSTADVQETFRKAFSWFRRGITVLADQIGRALELQCPSFYTHTTPINLTT